MAHFQPGLPPQNWGSRSHRVICDPKTPVNTALKPHGTGEGNLPLARAVAGISFLEHGVVSTDHFRQQIRSGRPPGSPERRPRASACTAHPASAIDPLHLERAPGRAWWLRRRVHRATRSSAHRWRVRRWRRLDGWPRREAGRPVCRGMDRCQQKTLILGPTSLPLGPQSTRARANKELDFQAPASMHWCRGVPMTSAPAPTGP